MNYTRIERHPLCVFFGCIGLILYVCWHFERWLRGEILRSVRQYLKGVL